MKIKQTSMNVVCMKGFKDMILVNYNLNKGAIYHK